MTKDKITINRPERPSYYWDPKAKTYKNIPTEAPRTVWHSGDEFKNEAQIAAESKQFTYSDLRHARFDVWEKERGPEPPVGEMPDYSGFKAGFDEGFKIGGELAGQTGFVSGANTAIRQLTAPINVGSFEHVDDKANAPLEQPRSTLASVRRDNLTAEVAKVISAYAILPRDLKIAAVLDAIESTTGARFVREPGHEGTTYIPKK